MNEIKKIDIVNFKKEPYIKFEEKFNENPTIIQNINNIETMNFEKKDKTASIYLPNTKDIKTINLDHDNGTYTITTNNGRIITCKKQNNAYILFENNVKLIEIKENQFLEYKNKADKKQMKNNIAYILGIDEKEVDLNNQEIIELYIATLALKLAPDEIILKGEDHKHLLQKFKNLFYATIKKYPADDPQGNNYEMASCVQAAAAIYRTIDPDMNSSDPTDMKNYLKISKKWDIVKDDNGNIITLNEKSNIVLLGKQGILKPGDLIISSKNHIMIYTGEVNKDKNIVEAQYTKKQHLHKSFLVNPIMYHDPTDSYVIYRPNTKKLENASYPVVNLKEIIE